MTYNAQYIEEVFTRIASIRIGEKIQGDGGYWYGGRCEWGGAHNLQEDCQTLTRFFTKTSELKNTKRKLTSFENKEDFENLKQDLISQCNTSIAGLQTQTGTNTSVGGVCIIWDDFVDHLKSILDDARSEIEKLKRDIERTTYDVARKLKRLKLEEKSLQKSIEENMKRAQNEKDPEKKRRFLILVDDDKKKLASNLEEQKKIRIGDNLNIDGYIRDFIEKIEQKLNPNRNPRTPTPNPTGPGSGSGSGTGRNPTPLNPFQPNPNQNQKDWFQTNKHLIIFAGIAILVIFYFYSQKDEEYYRPHD